MHAIPSRRQFAQALAVLAGATALPIAAQAQTPIPDAKAYAAALETVIRHRFGRQLTDDQVKRLQATLINRRNAGELLKQVELANGDDPIVAFRADLP